MNENKELAVREEPQISLGQLMFSDPADMLEKAQRVAAALKDVIDSQELFVTIRKKQHVYVEGWSTLGAMLGVVPRTLSVVEIKEGIFEATVELVTTRYEIVVGRGIAECGSPDELDKEGKPVWGDRSRMAKKSMAITRATGKAFRLSFSWIIKLAGYQPTPAEEMNGINDKPKTKAKAKTKAKTDAKVKADYALDKIYDAVVSEGLAENLFAAQAALEKCKTGYDTKTKAIKWMRSYRGFRDIGADPKQAAEKANKGETP